MHKIDPNFSPPMLVRKILQNDRRSAVFQHLPGAILRAKKRHSGTVKASDDVDTGRGKEKSSSVKAPNFFQHR